MASPAFQIAEGGSNFEDDSFNEALDNFQSHSNNKTESEVRPPSLKTRESFELDILDSAETNEGKMDNSKFTTSREVPHYEQSSSITDPFLTASHQNRHEQYTNQRTPYGDSQFLRIAKEIISQISTATMAKDTHVELSDRQVEREIHPSTTPVYDRNKFGSNEVSNAKYNAITFVPTLLCEQFKFFFNLYFLLVALSQAIPVLRIGYLSSYIVPLAFVLTVTMAKEAMDDLQRRKRDKEANSELYQVLDNPRMVASKDLRVGNLIRINKGDRVPADIVVLQSSEASGESFIKTDQLDGETDWKLRLACPLTQNLSESDLINKISLTISGPDKSIHKFVGKVTLKDGNSAPLSVDNTLWANTVLASSGFCIGCVAYTGVDTRQALNTTSAKAKIGLLELEINSISKILCACVLLLSIGLVLLAGFHNKDWYVDMMRYLILFSTIIPVSLRVNLDLAKSVYAHQIEHDKTIPETVVRTSTIPEDLGRIEYLLSDKTGTLTQNDMQLKKLHLGNVSYTSETLDILTEYVDSLVEGKSNKSNALAHLPTTSRKTAAIKARDLVITLALCHNVTPSFEDDEITYQAASPDEIAIVDFTKSVGLSLFKRDRRSIVLLHESSKTTLMFEILQIFPFNSESKRMGIIVRDQRNDDYWFMQKGADTVMSKIVELNDWLEEETGNMAREGLRTLVIGRKKLTKKVYELFHKDYKEASLSLHDREQRMANVVAKYLEYDLELLGLTGVEDKLQKDVKPSIELLRNAGIKIWMLTGDKVETARCVSVSAKLISRGQYVQVITKLSKSEGALNQLEYLRINRNACLLIDGESLNTFLKYYKLEFFDIVIHLPTVIACRCTPQQKADIAIIIREYTGKRVCCIGDGGNDVSMIQCADVGVGIVGKEGKQASLAADFSITQFCHLTKLLLWHGRNSYKRSAKLAQFVMHRGLIIAICQAVYSICSQFEPLALYQGWLMVGYATIYTMAPVFSLTLDHDIEESLTKIYPELYKELTEGKSLSYNTFFVWVALSVFQGIVVQGISQYFTGLLQSNFTSMVALSFTALVINELIMVALEIYTWNRLMVMTEIGTLLIYIISVPFLGDYFSLGKFLTIKFYGELILILCISIFPVWAAKAIYRKLHPPSYAKVRQFSEV